MINLIHEMGNDGSAFNVGYIILATLTTILHGIGILLLVKVRSNLASQRVIVINLAQPQAMHYSLKIVDRKWED